MKRASGWILCLLALAAVGGGCAGAVLKQGAGLLGAKVRYMPLGPAAPLGSPVTDVVCEPLANEVPTLAPAEFTGLVADALGKAIEKKKFLPPAPAGAAGNVLTVRGQLIHYQPRRQNTYAVARVELVANNQVIATAHCVSRGDSFTNSGTGKMAKGMARAIAKFVRATVKGDVGAATRPMEDEEIDDQDKDK
ncbi:MAG: hypothetical protein NT031_00360 [Planctomycetota bacterium]|nr:hypothetical protein [Planctomycetota bacterium]